MKKTLEQKVDKILKLFEESEKRFRNSLAHCKSIRYIDKKTNQTVAWVDSPMFIPPFPPMGLSCASQTIFLASADTDMEERPYTILMGEYVYKLHDQTEYVDGVSEEELIVYVEEVE